MDELLTEIGRYEPVVTNSVESPEEVDSLCRSTAVCLRIFHVNIRSVCKHFDELTVLLSQLSTKFDVIVLTESWLCKDNDMFQLPGYTTFNNCAKSNIADGTLVLVREYYTCSVSDLKFSASNSTQIQFQLNNNVFTILAIYRSPSNDVNMFLQELDNYLSRNNRSNNEMLTLIGDINIDILTNKNRNKVDEYLNLLTSHHLVSCINDYTRISDTSKSCLDHIFVSADHLSKTIPLVYKVSLTDHYAVILNIKTNLKVHRSCVQSTPTQINKVNFDMLKTRLASEEWTEVMSAADVDLATNTFIHTLTTHINSSTHTHTE